MRFGRKKGTEEVPEAGIADGGSAANEADAAPAAPDGPYDISEVELDENDTTRVDLGALIVTGRPGVELRLQVEESTQQVAAALLVTDTGAVELRAFASPRGEGIWPDVRRSISAEAARQGGTATEVEGPWGPELHLVVTGLDETGKSVTQPSRIVGITGPRWLLRATFFGLPATQPDEEHVLLEAVREVVVNRGSGAMAPGDFLPLTLPSNAQRLN